MKEALIKLADRWETDPCQHDSEDTGERSATLRECAKELRKILRYTPDTQPREGWKS